MQNKRLTDAFVTTDPGLRAQRRDAQAVVINVVLSRWNPRTGVDPAIARAQTRRAVNWLRAEGERRTRSEFVTALADNSTLTEPIWWGGAVRLGLHQFIEQGLVECDPDLTVEYHEYCSETHEYWWVGE